jgi:hypothetical protein
MKQSHQEFLLQVEEQLEAQLAEVISVFQNLSEDRLLQPADNGGWSIAECLEHLNTYAVFYLPRIKKALAKAPAIDGTAAFRHGFLGNYFINTMDPSQNTKKYKAMKKHRPVVITDPYPVVSRFIQYMEELLEMLQQAGNKNLMKTSVSTSISPLIKITVGDALQFMLTHNHRHLEQARQILEIK